MVIADIRDKQGQATAREIEQAGGQSMFVHCDVSRKPEVEALVQKTVET